MKFATLVSNCFGMKRSWSFGALRGCLDCSNWFKNSIEWWLSRRLKLLKILRSLKIEDWRHWKLQVSTNELLFIISISFTAARFSHCKTTSSPNLKNPENERNKAWLTIFHFLNLTSSHNSSWTIDALLFSTKVRASNILYVS